MKTPSLCAVFAALALPAFGQKMATPAGEAPGPWILGTIGVGKTSDPKVPQTTALKGLAIKVGEHGEASVAYDLDLCRMVGAWTGGKFTTPMNLMSRGEYPTALGEVAFTTGEVPGFLLGEGTTKDTKSTKGEQADLQRNGGVPVAAGGSAGSLEGVVPRRESALPGNGGVVAPSEGVAARKEGGALPQEGALPAQTGPLLPQKGTLPPLEGALQASEGTLPASGEGLKLQRAASVAQSNDPAVQSSSPVSQSNPPTGWQDPRPEPFGPLPPGQARFRGFYVNGGKTILKWDIGGVEVLEMPDLVVKGEAKFFVRHLVISPHKDEIDIALYAYPGAEAGWTLSPKGSPHDTLELNCEAIQFPSVSIAAIVLQSFGEGSLSEKGLHRVLTVAPSQKPQHFQVMLWAGPEQQVEHVLSLTDPQNRQRIDFLNPKFLDVVGFGKGGPARWPETVTTAGEVSDKQDEAYVVDTIKLPDPNPWGAPMFVGGFDFFPDDRAAVCTFHGDVFLVSGIDEKLEQVTWKRFASGLYHALGLKIVNGEIYVTCRDGLWRLKDLNGDGECDFYEAFNFDLKVTKSFHEFVFDLQTDPAGNFYYAKAGPVKNGGRGFDEIMAHHGTLLRVSPDGAKLEVMATGFRAPNGIGVGPRFELTSGDNEGTWTPACKINWIKPGGFYGVVDLAHRPTPPTDYDRPLCWLPKRVDNSGGSQVWVPEGAKWGPWGGQLLHLSYGSCSVFGVMREEIVGQAPRLPSVAGGAPALQTGTASVQGGVVRFPVNFQSGIMRARFNPADGQLYVAGLRGWQTTGVKNGAFQRVRYTGAPVRMPIGLHATKRGVRLTFTSPLDPATATDPQNWSVEVWNYLWSAAYGSPEFSTIEPVEKPVDAGKQGEAQFSKTQISQKKHDPLTVKSVTLSADARSVFLEIPEIKPVMQMAIKFGFKTADGTELRSEVINTIHALGD